MQITKDLLQSKLQEYQTKRQQAMTEANNQASLAAMFDGAIKDIQFWLEKLDEQPPAET